jgi:hypothetical protein
VAAAIEARAATELEGAFVRPVSGKRERTAPTIQRADALLVRTFAPIRWAIRDLLPEGLSLLVGPPKVGKSWLTLQLAIAISDGSSLWFGRPKEEQGDVLMLALEDNDRRLHSRLSKLNDSRSEMARNAQEMWLRTPDVSRIHFATSWPRMDKGGIEDLDKWLTANPATRLVIIDTLQKFRPHDNGRSTAYSSDYAIGDALKPLADRHKVAILAVHHTRKMTAPDVLDTVSGTQGLTGSVDALLLLRRERGQMDAALFVTGRDIEREDDVALQFNSESCTWSALGSVHTVAKTRERKAILDFIRGNGPSKPKDIAEGLGKKGSAVRRLLQKLFADGEVRIEDGKYLLPLIHSSGNAGNSSGTGADGDAGTTDTSVTPVTTVTGVTAPCTPSDYAGRRGE